MPDKVKVLVVDDENDLASLMEDVLGIAGFATASAGSGHRAMELLGREPFDFVLTDIRMGNGNGIELIEWIGKMQGSRPTVAAMSGYTEMTLAELMERGAVELFSKPPDFKSIGRSIRDCLQRQRTRWTNEPEAKPRGVRRFHLGSFEDSTASGELVFGRGGCFLATFDALSIGDEIGLELIFDKGKVSKLAMTTRVRWVREQRSPYFHEGVGLEVLGCERLAVGFLASYIEATQPQAFIPIGERSRTGKPMKDDEIASVGLRG